MEETQRNSELNKPYIIHMEIMRIFATFFVIYNHTGDNGFSWFLYCGDRELRYWICLFVSVICKISVPLFFMISGALLLGKNESLMKIFRRTFKILSALIVFSFLSYLQQIYFGNEVFNLKHFFTVLFDSDWMNPYWYLYLFMAYLLTLPFLRMIAQHLKKEYFVYLIVLALVFNGVVPNILYVLWKGKHALNPMFNMGWIIGMSTLYPLVGYYLENILEIQNLSKKKMCYLWIANFASIIWTCIITWYNNKITGQFPQTFLMSFVLLNCICIYLTLKKYVDIKNIKIRKAIVLVGKSTFGIYLIHGFLLRMPYISLWNYIKPYFAFPLYVNTLIRCLEIFIFGGLLTLVLKKIPIINKIL